MRRTPYALAIAAAAAAIVLAGCSSSSNAGQSGAGGASASASIAAPPLSDINEQPRSNLKQGGTLRDTISELPANWNWYTVAGNTLDLNNVYAYTAPQFWIYNKDATFKPNPTFLTSYAVKEATSSSPQVVTLNLNPKAVWNDGTPITWKDFAGTWKATSGENPKYDVASTDGFNQISGVKQGDSASQVLISFKSSYPDWSSIVSTVLPAAVTKDPDTFNNGWSKPDNAFGSGPYIISKLDQAQQTIYLKPNPKWWGEKPLLDSVSFRVLDPSAAASAFANDEIDVLSGITTGDGYSKARARADADIRESGSLQWRHFTFNTESGALSDVKVRTAIAKAIDRQAIAASDTAGIPGIKPAELLLGNHLFVPGQKGYQDNSAGYTKDVAGAKKLLDQAGWKLASGADYRAKGGKTLEIEYALRPDVPESKNEGELLQQYLKAVGIKVDLKNVDSSTYFSDTVPKGQFGITSFWWIGTNYPMANIGQIYGTGSGSNFQRYSDKKLDALIPKVDTEADSAKRIQLANQADRLVWKDVTVLPLYRTLSINAVPKKLANYGSATFQTVPRQDVGYQK